MNLCSIASGSSGNCIYIGSERTHIMVDAGISGKRIEAGLNSIGLKTADMKGVLITHEHSDHIKGLGVVARRYGIPIYATRGTIQRMKGMSSLGKIPEELFQEIQADQEFTIEELNIYPFKISHDAAEPVAYRVNNEKKSVGIATDLGVYDEYIVRHLKDADILFLEANHDVHMLEVGGYPYHLKRRIAGDKGHLSNELSGKLLCELLHDRLKAVFLGHLSQENNYEELAFETVKLEINLADVPYKANDFLIQVAKRDAASQLIHI